MASGDLALVLHAHLPFIRHPEHRYHLEENWLYEATVATYLPLLDVFRGLARDGVPFRLTLSLSPPLCTMLRDDLLKTRTAQYLDRLLRLGESEVRRTAGDPTFHRIARFYADRFGRLKALYDELRGDLVGAFRALQDDGLLEIITVGATHGFLPVIREPQARRAQILGGLRELPAACSAAGRAASGCRSAATSRASTRCWPRQGSATSSSTRTASLNAKPQPPLRRLRARCSARPAWPRSAAISSRRSRCGAPNEGYPGDGVYRDFYRDIGFDLPLDYVGPYIHPDGIRVHTGFKYFRVTGPASTWRTRSRTIPSWRARAAAEHAGNFMFNREKQIEHLAAHMDRRPLVVSPYDAELYGHWWFEGPEFLDYLARKVAFDQTTVRAGHLRRLSRREPGQRGGRAVALLVGRRRLLRRVGRRHQRLDLPPRPPRRSAHARARPALARRRRRHHAGARSTSARASCCWRSRPTGPSS